MTDHTAGMMDAGELNRDLMEAASLMEQPSLEPGFISQQELVHKVKTLEAITDDLLCRITALENELPNWLDAKTLAT